MSHIIGVALLTSIINFNGVQVHKKGEEKGTAIKCKVNFEANCDSVFYMSEKDVLL